MPIKLGQDLASLSCMLGGWLGLLFVLTRRPRGWLLFAAALLVYPVSKYRHAIEPELFAALRLFRICLMERDSRTHTPQSMTSRAGRRGMPIKPNRKLSTPSAKLGRLCAGKASRQTEQANPQVDEIEVCVQIQLD